MDNKYLIKEFVSELLTEDDYGDGGYGYGGGGYGLGSVSALKKIFVEPFTTPQPSSSG